MEDTLRPHIERQVGSVFSGEKHVELLSLSSQVMGDHSAAHLVSPHPFLSSQAKHSLSSILIMHIASLPLWSFPIVSDDEMCRAPFIPDLQADRAAGSYLSASPPWLLES